VPSFGAVRLGNATGLGLIVIWSALGLALTALGLALGFGAEIGAALANGMAGARRLRAGRTR
jgi:hypothetical protein